MTRLLPWLRAAVAAMTLLLAAPLCWQCIDIYAAGNAPENLTADGVHIEQVYRADDVGARLTTLAIPAAAYAVLIAVTAIVQHRAPEKPEASAMTADNRLRLMMRRVTELPEAAKYEETLRRNIFDFLGKRFYRAVISAKKIVKHIYGVCVLIFRNDNLIATLPQIIGSRMDGCLNGCDGVTFLTAPGIAPGLILED